MKPSLIPLGLALMSFLALNIFLVNAQSCEPYIPSGSKCDTFMTGINVYIPPKATQQAIQETVVYPQAILLGAFIPQVCRSTALQLLCAASFPPCFIVNNSLAVLYPCKDLCEAMVASCQSVFTALGKQSSLPNCTPLPTAPLPCVNITSYTAPEYTQLDCPYPLKIDKEAAQSEITDPSELCIYPCPGPMYSDSEYDGGWIPAGVVGFLSFFTGTFMIVTWMLSPTKRRFPNTIILSVAIAATGLSTVPVWAALWGGPREVVCTEDDPPRIVQMRYADGHDTGCVMQGILLLYFGLASNFCWLGLVIHLFSTVAYKFKYIQIFYALYNVFAWVFPIIPVIVALAAQQMAGSLTYSYCFWSDFTGNSQETYRGYFYGLYFGFSLLVLVIGTILIVSSLITLAFHKCNWKDHSKASVWYVLRLIGMIAVLWWLLLYIDIFAIYSSVKEDDWKASVEDQVRCSATTGTECSLDDHLNYGMWWLNLLSVASPACVIFLFMCTTLDVFWFWARLIKALFTPTNPHQWWANMKAVLVEHDEETTSESSNSGDEDDDDKAL